MGLATATGLLAALSAGKPRNCERRQGRMRIALSFFNALTDESS